MSKMNRYSRLLDDYFGTASSGERTGVLSGCGVDPSPLGHPSSYWSSLRKTASSSNTPSVLEPYEGLGQQSHALLHRGLEQEKQASTFIIPQTQEPAVQPEELLEAPLSYSWIEISFLDQFDSPCGGLDFEIILPDGKVLKRRTNAFGTVLMRRVLAGLCRVSIPGLESSQWGLTANVDEVGKDSHDLETEQLHILYYRPVVDINLFIEFDVDKPACQDDVMILSTLNGSWEQSIPLGGLQEVAPDWIELCFEAVPVNQLLQLCHVVSELESPIVVFSHLLASDFKEVMLDEELVSS